MARNIWNECDAESESESDAVNPKFHRFEKSTPVQPKVKDRNHMERPIVRGVFQRLSVTSIGMPRLWSPHDQVRALDEGWMIGAVVRSREPGWRGMRQSDPPSIGRTGGVFISDDAAHKWVIEQADKADDPASIYRRALAVLMALAIRQVD